MEKRRCAKCGEWKAWEEFFPPYHFTATSKRRPGRRIRKKCQKCMYGADHGVRRVVPWTRESR